MLKVLNPPRETTGIGAQPDWHGPPDSYEIGEQRCVSDAYGPAIEKQYQKASIGFVISGWFDYRSEGGGATALPGTVLLGNCGECFRCRHFDTVGNRRLVIAFEKWMFEDLAAGCGFAEPRFRVVAIPPGRAASAIYAWMLVMAQNGGDAENAACNLAAAVMAAERRDLPARQIPGRDRRRIKAVVQYIEESYSEPCLIGTLAAVSGVSRYHFMRVFKAITGQSPNQYVINTRLRAAALRLTDTKQPVSDIALDVGFNDISHFNTCFRMMFNCTPRQLRGGFRGSDVQRIARDRRAL